jgi:hypothetical protein
MSLYTLDDFMDTTPPTADRSGSGWVLREVDTPARYVGHRCAEQVGPLVSYKRRQKARDIGRDSCDDLTPKYLEIGANPVPWYAFLATCSAAEVPA